MVKRRKKKAAPLIHLSVGPLPPRLAEHHAGCRLIFSDASQLRHGGLAAVLFADADSEAQVATRSVPVIGSNELELQAALFALEEVGRHFPGQPAALFSDNLDAVTRLGRAKAQGSAQDGALIERFPGLDIDALLLMVDVCWIPGHGRCRGNALADLHARSAAA
jgi:ribonuclease HI